MIFKEQQRALPVAGSEGDRAGLICRADDLKAFLGQLSDQIADADRRHSETLRDMRDRLARLGDRTGELRDALPKTFEAEIDRIETGMAKLADQISTTEEERSANAKAPQRAPGASEPPALRSAVTAATAAAAAATAVPQQPAPMLRDDEPWDSQSATALADLYDSGEAGPARTRTLQDYGIASPPVAATPELPVPLKVTIAAETKAEPLAVMAAPDAAVVPQSNLGDIRAPSYDSAHLDRRLDDIAARLDESLSALRGDRSLADLNSRFDQLEESWSSAISGVATRSDIEGLRHLEAHVTDLAKRIEETQVHLARLDAIEHQLGHLGSRLTDENIVNLFGNLVPTEHDLTRFAEQAADRTASMMAGSSVAGAGAGAAALAQAPAPDVSPMIEAAQAATEEKLDILQKMLSGFIDERRQGATETSEALITLQEAMQVVLDRVDAIETRVTTAPAAAGPGAAPHTMPAHYVPTEPDAAHDAGRQPLPRETSAVAFEEAKAAARAARSSAGRGQPADQGTGFEGPAPMPTGAQAARQAGRAGATASVELRSGQDAIRRAGPSARSPEADRNDAQPGKPGIRERLLGAAKSPDKSAMKPGLILVPCVGLLLLAGYWFLVAPKNRNIAPQAARIEQVPLPKSGAPAKQSPNAPAIDTEKAPGRPSPASTPGQTELQLPKGPTPVLDNRSDARPSPGASQSLAEAPQAEVVSPAAGISVQHTGQPMTQQELASVRQQMHLASLSQRTAQTAAAISAAQPVAIPAAVRQSDDDQPEGARAAPGTSEQGQTVLELPPAQVGPMSLRLAAAKGDPSAQFEVASRFAEGKGLKQDFGQAAAWYQKAATQGLAAAQYRLAALFERGLGVKADPARAKIWYTRAAEQGNVKAMHNLAVLSAGRDQTTADYASAARWFNEAAERGLADSQYNLGVLHESGLGVPRNLIAAYKWYSLAAQRGDKEALRRRDMLKAKLDATSLANGEASIQSWRASPVESAANDAIVAGTAWQKRATRQQQGAAAN